MLLQELNRWDDRLKIVEEDYFTLLLAQLIKDVNNEKFEIKVRHFIAKDFDDLEKATAEFVEAVYLEGGQKFSQLMYTIDMPEKQLSTFVKGSEKDWTIIANQLLRRECLKVFIKQNYRSH